MGDIWNRHVFVDPQSFTYEKNLHPFVPTKQMCGFICGEGCSGGPVFNVRGEVVGRLQCLQMDMKSLFTLQY